MRKEQKQLIIFIVLICVAGLIFARIIFKSGKAGKGLLVLHDRKEIAGEVDKPAAKLDFFELEEELKKNRPQLKWVRNPFQFPPKKEVEKTDVGKLNLTGIIYDETSPVAVINDIIVHEGDEIEGVKVIKIETEEVLLEEEGESYTLELLKREE